MIKTTCHRCGQTHVDEYISFEAPFAPCPNPACAEIEEATRGEILRTREKLLKEAKESPDWGSTKRTWNKMEDGNWKCPETGETHTEEDFERLYLERWRRLVKSQ